MIRRQDWSHWVTEWEPQLTLASAFHCSQHFPFSLAVVLLKDAFYPNDFALCILGNWFSNTDPAVMFRCLKLYYVLCSMSLFWSPLRWGVTVPFVSPYILLDKTHFTESNPRGAPVYVMWAQSLSFIMWIKQITQNQNKWFLVKCVYTCLEMWDYANKYSPHPTPPHVFFFFFYQVQSLPKVWVWCLWLCGS